MDKITGLQNQITKLQDSLRGTEKERGFFERVRDLEDWTGTQKKVYWVFGGALGVDILARLSALIFK